MLISCKCKLTGVVTVDDRRNTDAYDIRLFEVKAYGKEEPKPEDLGYEKQPGGYLLKVR